MDEKMEIINANELLTQDHKDLEEHYKEYLRTSGDERKEHERRILTDLTIHADVEEELFYPELEKAGEEDLAREYKAEHNQVKMLVSKIAMESLAGRDTSKDMRRLMDNVMRHAKKEEAEGMPLIESLIGRERLEELAPIMLERREELLESTTKKLWAALPSM